ncbi:beta-lactamase family protein [Aspergillus campestris IBT 28561]|uniref:Beta-lactamase family protein n=1 Tax=Aspergillus campestris (strain IBT 28561) TaxID=1392248 RepID=A0A2I1D4I7_ASPC2|nr:beta-lactamase family protein [Aspergillus campestris IBT 28561]PKY04768.1 beta-lactamase family protein [Aspergillus campestris IBT 28561]
MHLLLHLASALYFIQTSTAQLPPIPSLKPIPSYSGCPRAGPLLPKPTNLSQSAHIKNAAHTLTTALDSALKGEIRAGWPVDNVSFSIGLVSPNGGQGAKPIWEYHHRAALNTQGTETVTGDSQYLIGSVSKVFSDLLLLKSGVDVRTPVTHFFPELAAPESAIPWSEITLETLGEHLAGIPPNYVYEFYYLQPYYESMGLPHLDPSDYPPCGVVGLNEILRGLLSTLPVNPVNSRPTYSQLSFLLFTFCLEQATGKNYSTLLQETILQPLNLTNTGVSPGDTQQAVIPPGPSSWGSDFGFNAPGGGLFSTLNDLTTLATSILAHTILPTPAAVRKWLKPTSMTSSPSTLVGSPWEILRTTHLIPNNPHTVDIFGKSGGALGYTAQFSLVDQYGVGVVVLTAGPVGALDLLYRAVLGTFLPAVEAETRDQSAKYTGTWTSPSSSQSNPNITLSLSHTTGPGLHLTTLTQSNTSIKDALTEIYKTQYTPLGFGLLSPDMRLYPSGIETPISPAEASSLGHPSKRLVRQDWRINLDIVPLDGEAMSDLPGQGGWNSDGDAYCAGWQMGDWMRYGGEALDRVVFVVDVGGEVVGVEVPGLRSGMLVSA